MRAILEPLKTSHRNVLRWRSNTSSESRRQLMQWRAVKRNLHTWTTVTEPIRNQYWEVNNLEPTVSHYNIIGSKWSSPIVLKARAYSDSILLTNRVNFQNQYHTVLNASYTGTQFKSAKSTNASWTLGVTNFLACWSGRENTVPGAPVIVSIPDGYQSVTQPLFLYTIPSTQCHTHHMQSRTGSLQELLKIIHGLKLENTLWQNNTVMISQK